MSTTEERKENFKWYIAYVPIKEEERMLTKVKTVCERMFGDSYSEHIKDIRVLKSQFTKVKDGEMKEAQRIAYPGYLLINAQMSYQLKTNILSIHGVRAFFSNPKGEPQAMSNKEFEELLASVDKISEKNNDKGSFKVGDKVKIKDGSFQEFQGTVASVDHENKTLQLKIFVFGKEVDLQTSFTSVEKV